MNNSAIYIDPLLTSLKNHLAKTIKSHTGYRSLLSCRQLNESIFELHKISHVCKQNPLFGFTSHQLGGLLKP